MTFPEQRRSILKTMSVPMDAMFTYNQGGLPNARCRFLDVIILKRRVSPRHALARRAFYWPVVHHDQI